jgi:hypothetical protein
MTSLLESLEMELTEDALAEVTQAVWFYAITGTDTPEDSVLYYILNDIIAGSGTGTIDANVISVSGDTTAADNMEKFFDGTGYGLHPRMTTVYDASSSTEIEVVDNSGFGISSLIDWTIVLHHDTSTYVGRVTSINGGGVITLDWLNNTPASIDVGDAVEFYHPQASVIEHEVSLATQVGTVDDFLDTEIAAIKAKTDNLPASPANEATLTTIATYIDTEVAAIKAKTDNLPSDPADASDIATSFATVNSTLSTIAGYIDTEVAAIVTSLSTLTGYVDTEVAAIKAKTDNLPAGFPTNFTLLAIDGAGAVTSNAEVEISPEDIEAIAEATADAVGEEVAENVWHYLTTGTDFPVDSFGQFFITYVAAIRTKTDNLPTDPADASVIAGSFTTVGTTLATIISTLATIEGYIDSEVAAIKARTDLLPLRQPMKPP